MPFLNKKQSDLLGWTDKGDANDVILLDEEGNIVRRRYILALFPGENDEYINEASWGELDENGEWQWKSKRN